MVKGMVPLHSFPSPPLWQLCQFCNCPFLFDISITIVPKLPSRSFTRLGKLERGYAAFVSSPYGAFDKRVAMEAKVKDFTNHPLLSANERE